MKINKIIILFIIFCSISIYAQKEEYKFLINDNYGNKIYEKLESKTGNKVYVWQKIEESFENDPSTAFTEYYLQINCESKTSILKELIIHWRDGNIEKHNDPSNKEVPINNMESLPGLSYKKYCTK
ncbi:hypothetical protein SAMN05421856_1252 [Chryseobacterium taichungense]|uniref:Uncharacterized protein n=1 Tax=Chryseobacterium taichungense TaxID=295069 RepID=A0A1H8DZI3_9FLAO|nr:hypothetical protein [Chryseobacterium taichungense]SEN12682.1 hypothetical protein SAMN05421856_1252 [Chryseobacterium taichungense]